MANVVQDPPATASTMLPSQRDFINQWMKLGSNGEMYCGTVFPSKNFDPKKDCEDLKLAMGVEEPSVDVITEIMTKRSNSQRQEILKTFPQMFGDDLIALLKSSLVGDYGKVVNALMRDPVCFDAKCLRKSMTGVGTDENVLIEILCSRTKEEIDLIKSIYNSEYSRDLEADIKAETSGEFRNALICASQSNRHSMTESQVNLLFKMGVNSSVDWNLATREAQELFNSGEKKFGTDESVFIRIFCERTVYQLQATFKEYERLVGHNILRAIDSETSGNFRNFLKAIALNATDRPLFFARCLQKSMKGLGTDDSTLIRILVSRSEIDLQNIKDTFLTKYGKTLESWIIDDTSGEYKNILLKLIGW